MSSFPPKNNVNIRAIAQGASERNISVVINEKDVKKALNTLHERFFEDNTKQLNLFVMGVGNVGEKFIDQLYQQKKFLKDNLKINPRVIALSNSRQMLFNEDGIEFIFIIFTKEDIMQSQFFKFFFNTPVKNNT